MKWNIFQLVKKVLTWYIINPAADKAPASEKEN